MRQKGIFAVTWARARSQSFPPLFFLYMLKCAKDERGAGYSFAGCCCWAACSASASTTNAAASPAHPQCTVQPLPPWPTSCITRISEGSVPPGATFTLAATLPPPCNTGTSSRSSLTCDRPGCSPTWALRILAWRSCGQNLVQRSIMPCVVAGRALVLGSLGRNASRCSHKLAVRVKQHQRLGGARQLDCQGALSTPAGRH